MRIDFVPSRYAGSEPLAMSRRMVFVLLPHMAAPSLMDSHGSSVMPGSSTAFLPALSGRRPLRTPDRPGGRGPAWLGLVESALPACPRRASGALEVPGLVRGRVLSVPVEVVSLAPIAIGQAMSLMVGCGNSTRNYASAFRAYAITDTPKCTNWLGGTRRGMRVSSNKKTRVVSGFFSWAIQDLNL